jgi:hypothetical protein
MARVTWKLKRTTQCKHCPWRKGTNPHEIPNGYSVERHKRLAKTIVDPTNIVGQFAQTPHAMACHELHDAHCIGWLMNQLRDNNIPLRILMTTCGNVQSIRLRGEQHERFEDTLPKDAV